MDKEIQERIDDILSGMDVKTRSITKPILEEFVWYSTHSKELQDQLDEEGSLIEMEKGGPNNRHKELVEHPAVKVVCKYSTQASSHYAKLMRYLNKAETAKVDDLEEFLKTR